MVKVLKHLVRDKTVPKKVDKELWIITRLFNLSIADIVDRTKVSDAQLYRYNRGLSISKPDKERLNELIQKLRAGAEEVLDEGGLDHHYDNYLSYILEVLDDDVI